MQEEEEVSLMWRAMSGRPGLNGELAHVAVDEVIPCEDLEHWVHNLLRGELVGGQGVAAQVETETKL